MKFFLLTKKSDVYGLYRLDANEVSFNNAERASQCKYSCFIN
ncbi:hypothetical protein GPSY_2911 [Paraglaciecola psychrophila 170]|nr:hypothetical protein GPSY_2911 [Paraglaciecola psychrophila 170]